MSRPIDADLLGLTDMEIIMCDGDYKEALKMLIDKIEHAPTIEPSPIWHECFDDDHESFPDDDRTVLVSFENFSQPMLGQWRFDPDIGGAWYIGDTDETFIENDLFVDGWWELPRKPEVKG